MRLLLCAALAALPLLDHADTPSIDPKILFSMFNTSGKKYGLGENIQG